MKIAIVGFDTEGRSSYEYFSALEHDITIHDQKTDLETPEGVPGVFGDAYLDDLDRYDLIVRTAGLHPNKILAKNPGVAAKITTQINEFLEVCPTEHIIGVTGTKGKGTTSTLITRMLEADTKHVKLGGNIGVPPLSFVHELTNQSWVVLELSSFQLIDLRRSPQTAVCLMVVPEHLDWHADLDEYLTAKSQLFRWQTPADSAIFNYHYETSTAIASVGDGQKVPYLHTPGAVVGDNVITIQDQVICSFDDIKLLGAHNRENICAAVTAVWQATQNVVAIRSVIQSFSGLEHRLEFVRTHEGVDYYDDSFGTTPETAIVAMQAFQAPKVLILGGHDKKAPYQEMAAAVKTSNVRHVLLIGEQAGRIGEALRAADYHGYSAGGDTMAQIVQKAHAIAHAGDTVLLSPACASYGMFKNYKDRGNQFKAAVQAL